MRIGIFSNAIATGSVDDVIADVRAAEDDGFASYWCGQIFGYDTLTVLGLAAAATEAIELGTSVVPTFPRHPAMLAAQARTVQHIAEGRLTLGIGLSHQPVIESMFKMSFDKPLRHMREYLDVLMPLVNGDSVNVEGETIGAALTLDVDSPPVPVLVAALGPKMIKLAAARTSGTALWMTGPTTIAEHIAPKINEAAAAAGNPAPRIECGLPVCVTDDPAAARARAAKVYAVYGHLPSYRAMLEREGATGPEDLAIIGDENHVAERIAAVADAGATDLAANEFGRGDEERARTRALLRDLVNG